MSCEGDFISVRVRLCVAVEFVGVHVCVFGSYMFLLFFWLFFSSMSSALLKASTDACRVRSSAHTSAKRMTHPSREQLQRIDKLQLSTSWASVKSGGEVGDVGTAGTRWCFVCALVVRLTERVCGCLSWLSPISRHRVRLAPCSNTDSTSPSRSTSLFCYHFLVMRTAVQGRSPPSLVGQRGRTLSLPFRSR